MNQAWTRSLPRVAPRPRRRPGRRERWDPSRRFRPSRPALDTRRSILILGGLGRGSTECRAVRGGVRIEGTLPLRGEGMRAEQFAELTRSFSQADVDAFGALAGDMNPVHFPTEPSDAPEPRLDGERRSDRGTPIVHGILLSSVFSTIFGTLVPGCLYRGQSLRFRRPVHVDEEVRGRVVVTKLRRVDRRGGDGGVLCSCDTTIAKIDNQQGTDDEGDGFVLCVSGEAQVWLPGATVGDE
ncbi:hypothetical protein ACHAWF_006310 [Thalassiosira exigua]